MHVREARNLIKPPWYKHGCLRPTATLIVRAGRQAKRSLTAYGNDPVFDDTLEFLLGMLL